MISAFNGNRFVKPELCIGLFSRFYFITIQKNHFTDGLSRTVTDVYPVPIAKQTPGAFKKPHSGVKLAADRHGAHSRKNLSALQFLLLNSRQIEGRALAGISSFRLLAVIFNSSYLDNASLGIDFYLLAQPAAAFQQRARHHRAKPLH